ncbi:MAG: TIGR03435 family protein [Acidobacteriaceae bacterium]|jgi:uncharacterized protein (TIGR03435 family)|nr:TIGR03435 family protein [Acidobacteriaceae bacterium]
MTGMGWGKGALLMVLVAVASAASAQSPQFDVVSVKPSNPNPASPLESIPSVTVPGGGRFTARNLPFMMLVFMAYSLPDDRIVGLPEWKSTARFDINGKADAQLLGTTRDLPPLLQSMLADRFQFRAHTESREMPTSVLTIARSDGKLGADLHPSTADCTAAQEEQKKQMEAIAKGGQEAMAAAAAMMPKPGEIRKCNVSMSVDPATSEITMHGDGLPLAQIIALLERTVNMPVVDETGLTGLFDWNLRVDRSAMLAMASSVMQMPLPGQSSASPTGPSFVAALREQLGLKVTTEKRTNAVLVIDNVSLPTPD